MQYWMKAAGSIVFILLAEALFINGLQTLIFRQCKKIETQKTKMEKQENAILADIQCFPVPLAYRDEISYEDTYGAARQAGGHEGCDIMDQKNIPGRIPVVSATDGTVTNVGWLYLGGYRIGITSQNHIYYYYAHLDSYAKGIQNGRKVKAGELLGFMGNTGEGEEGTEGKFDVHLHFGIYVKDKQGNEQSVNSYPFLQKIDEE